MGPATSMLGLTLLGSSSDGTMNGGVNKGKTSDEKPLCMEDLPNELWLEVFGYLDWLNLYLAFYGINKRINELLTSINTLSLYSSYLITHSSSIYVCFQEFPMHEFKQIQHFRLLYDTPYVDALNISKHLPSFLNLTSLKIEANTGELGCTSEFAMTIFRENFPFLQRLHLDGNVFEQDLPVQDNECLFHFPSLLHIHLSRLHFILALQLLDQYPQLRSFSARLYGDPMRDSTTSSLILLSDRIRMGLPDMKKLSLRQEKDFGNEFGTTFLELFLPCCPNLHTFMLDVQCIGDWERLLEVDWWPRMFASHNKLKRISLYLPWTTRSIHHNWHEKYERFRASPFFKQFNATVGFDFDSEFMRYLTYKLYVRN